MILANTTVRAVSARVREIRAELEVPAVFGGIDRILPAVRAIADWSAQARDGRAAEAPLPPVTPLRLPAEPRGAWSEAVCRDLLTEAGIPVVPGVVASTPAAAAAAAAAYGVPVALKVVSADLLHKSDLGGVALQVAAADAAQAAAALLRRVATAVPAARVDGVLVSPMRPDGLDLLIGVVREPGWGNVLAVGLGGLWAEAIRDVQRIAFRPPSGRSSRGCAGSGRGRCSRAPAAVIGSTSPPW